MIDLCVLNTKKNDSIFITFFYLLPSSYTNSNFEWINIGRSFSSNNYNSILLLTSASFGNILGSVVNWILGFYFYNLINSKWFPFNQKQVDSASLRFKKFGIWSLLFAWLPVVGDPLTFIAGVLRTNFILFLILVSIGKILRYFFIFYVTQ